MSEDPIGLTAGDSNFTRMVGNSVLNATDPSGLKGPRSKRLGPRRPTFGDDPITPSAPNMPRRNRPDDFPSAPPFDPTPIPRSPIDLPLPPPETITGCSCVWKGSFDLTFYALVYSFYGHLSFSAQGEDEFGNRYFVDHNSSLGLLKAGGGILGAGRAKVKSEFNEIVAPCEWPASTGDEFAVAIVGIANVPHPDGGLNFPGATLFRVGVLEWWDIGAFGGQNVAMVGGGLGGQLETVSHSRTGPF